ncbi:LOW QUALITY PROTEIN: hypothetical protein OSB04_027703 [Centaurea solstitialis]|uniref:non-specific serine/threonine protein kinase n=1 Tax=Centaurea solstitialis TaxID=347529 RepID=A0AA38SXW2_9ASTR|nr:LOW QUALITY PROTEIN: hypothetical protein OSB04_027703 [Centaurea solstitialis]
MCSSFFPKTAFLVLTLLIQMYGVVSRSSIHADHHALLEIKSKITIDPQGVLESWNDFIPLCMWQGVTCGHRHQRVTGLNLTDIGLVGSLSPYIGNLSFLTYMNFSYNQLHGSIPPEIGRLSRLQVLFLRKNSFTGEIPVNISSCSKLSVISLSNNMLSGKIPKFFSSMLMLKGLGLGENKLTGGIPPSIGNLTSLEILSLSSCPLGGVIPDTFSQLKNLQQIYLMGNGLVGPNPLFLFNYSRLELVNIVENQLLGSLPSNLCLSKPHLRILLLEINYLSGMFPPSISNCSELEIFDATDNFFEGEINIDFGKLQNLRQFSIGRGTHGHHLGGMKYFDSLSNCSNLETLVIGEVDLRRGIPDSLGNLTKLSVLLLQSSYMLGGLPSSIGDLFSLTVLSLFDNNFTGMIPESIGKLQNLGELSLVGNSFSGIIPRSIGNMSSLIKAYLGINKLEGTIPSTIGKCKNLLLLSLHENYLRGIGLDLSRNNLSGVLPKEIGDLKNLGSLDLSDNRLSGELPSGFSSYVSLQTLNLSGNFFHGSMPMSLSSLRGLEYVDVSRNNFSGHIPTYFQELVLKGLDLSYNNFEGEVYVKGVFANASAISVVGNPRQVESFLFVFDFTVIHCCRSGSAIICLVPLLKKREKPSDSLLTESFEKISYGRLFKATEGFSAANLIGTGGFGLVYKGVLDEIGLTVAIKVLNLQHRGGSRSFMAECEALRNIRHRNLVKVITSCSSIDFQGNDFKALVYDFMPNGSLETWLHSSMTIDHLHHDDQLPQLNLVQRISIAKDVAYALDYLHYRCGNVVIHRDLKPSNILLDADMVAHISGSHKSFRLTNFLMQTRVAQVIGTIGYAPPEYGVGNEVSTGGDIYSYGILLLETLTGKKPIDPMFRAGLSLHSYSASALAGGFVLQIVDPKLLHDDVKEECLVSLLKIGVQCSSEAPQDRMDIGAVIHELLSATVTGIGLTRSHDNSLVSHDPKSMGSIHCKPALAIMCSSFFPKTAFLVLTLLIQTYGVVSRSGIDTDHRALLEIKSKITIDPQGVLESWNDSIPLCMWQGVTCGRRHHRVTGLNLTDIGLVGSLSPYIGNLSFLMYMNLRSNQLHGSIPPEIGRLSRLQFLSLFQNSFTGEIPVNISSCSKLSVISLSTNMLSGKIPKSFSSMSMLKWLDLGKNKLTGGIPPSIGNLTSLEVLSFHSCPLGGVIPDTFSQLKNLQTIVLEANGLVGLNPLFLFNLSKLERVSIIKNQLVGSLPSNLCLSQPHLRRLLLEINYLSGIFPHSISNCSELEEFDVGDNFFKGEINIDFGKLQNLRLLVIGGSHLGTHGRHLGGMKYFDSLSNCSNLELLEIGEVDLRRGIPDSIGNLTKLRGLILQSSYMLGSLPSSIGNLFGLTILSLSGNNFTGMIPESIGKLRNLGVLSIADDSFSGIIPRSIGNLSSLTELYFDGNKLEGTIPSTIGRCKNLLLLSLYDNNLSGSVPKELFQVSSLSIGLDLSRNNLSGVLPREIGNLKNLGSLDLSDNRLSGELPSGFSSYVSLQTLNLSGNFFHGSMPMSLSSLRGLEYVDVSRNNFSGHIPTYLQQLALKQLDLSYNNFEGEIYVKGVFANTSAISVVGNPRLCGGVLELHLPTCRTTTSRKLSLRVVVAISLSSAIAGMALLSFVLFHCCRKKKREKPIDSMSTESFAKISYERLFKATEGFSAANLIGTGGFGLVYKGVLDEIGLTVAIKVLNLQHQGGSRSFMAECEALRNIRHRNLVKVITSCSSIDFQGNDFKALVYDFMPNGSVDTWLHSSTTVDHLHHVGLHQLNLVQRISIAKDVAYALDYLHYQCGNVFVHRDLKPSNILLDADMVAHVGDFGLAKILSVDELPDANKSSSSHVRGTIGYAPPGKFFLLTNALFTLSNLFLLCGDIYSYGILLLEMLTGKKTH